MTELIKKADEGRVFDFLTERVSIKVWGRDTNNAYSLMRWTVGPLANAPPHVHERYEETFYVLSGRLEFLLGQETIPLSAGDFARVPPGVRHGYRNATEDEVELLVSLTPGGMEELFYKYRAATQDFDLDAYIAEARDTHATDYEIGG